MALSSRCLSRHGCILCHRVQHTDALLNLDILVLLTPGLLLNSKYGPVRQQLKQRYVKFLSLSLSLTAQLPQLERLHALLESLRLSRWQP